MPIDWWSRDQLPFTLMIILGILGVILFQGGYHLGWWNDFHNFGTVVSLVGIALGVAATWLLGASKRQVQGIRQDVREVGQDVRGIGESVRQVGQDVRQVDVHLQRVGSDITSHQERQTAILLEIRDRLPPR